MSESQRSHSIASTMSGFMARVKGTFQRKNSGLDEGGLRLLFSEDDEENGPLALYSPNPSAEHLGVWDEPERTRSYRLLNCVSTLWLSRRRLWSLLGFVSLLFVASISIRVFLWDRETPQAWNGYMDIPEYSTTLGCLDAPHVSEPTTFEIPVISNGAHSIDINGGLVGTLVIAGADENATQVQYELKLMAEDKNLLNAIRRHPASSDTSAMRISSVSSSSPDFPCQRYDITVRVPPTVRHLSVQTEGPTHVLFDRDSAPLTLASLAVSLRSADPRNMLLTHMGVQADALSFSMGGGWLSGNMLLVANTTLLQSGRSTMLVDLVPSNAPALASVPAVLRTVTGAGRSMVTHRHFSGAAHRPIDSVHQAAGGLLEINYADAAFEGSVEVTARRLSASGRLHGSVVDGAQVRNKRMWVGDSEGKDLVKIESSRGAVRLVF